MSDPLKFGFEFSNTPSARPRDPDQPMRILVLGNFGGHDSRSEERGPAPSKIQAVDVDNLEDLLAKIRPAVRVPLGEPAGAVVEIEISELDDFHPDQLYRNLDVFQQLRDLRKRLQNPETFSQAAAELIRAVPGEGAKTNRDVPRQADAAAETDSDLLDRILGGSAATADGAQARSSQADVSSLINQIVAPYVVPGPDPRQEEYVQSLDAAVSAQMRAILHDKSFQSLESIWRGLQYLVSHVETSEELQIFLWDVTETELRQASESDSGRWEDSLSFNRLVTEREQDPYSLMVSAEYFAGDEGDLSLLGTLGAIAAHAGAPLLASAAPSLLGLESWTDQMTATDDEDAGGQAWRSLRSSPVAPWIGLAAPRMLLRLPYGAATDPIDAFIFEELDDPIADHESFLWGTPAIACATLIATSFVRNGWAMSLGDQLELGDLPAATFVIDEESQLKPCAEVSVPQRVGESMLASGVMPLLSFKNRNAVRLMRFQSIANPPVALSGPWS